MKKIKFRFYAIIALVFFLFLESHSCMAKNDPIVYINYTHGQIISFSSRHFREYQMTIPQTDNYVEEKIHHTLTGNTSCVALGEAGENPLFFANPNNFSVGKNYHCGDKLFYLENCLNFGKTKCVFSNVIAKDKNNGKDLYSYTFSSCKGIVSYRPYYNNVDEFILSTKYGLFHDPKNC